MPSPEITDPLQTCSCVRVAGRPTLASNYQVLPSAPVFACPLRRPCAVAFAVMVDKQHDCEELGPAAVLMSLQPENGARVLVASDVRETTPTENDQDQGAPFQASEAPHPPPAKRRGGSHGSSADAHDARGSCSSRRGVGSRALLGYIEIHGCSHGSISRRSTARFGRSGCWSTRIGLRRTVRGRLGGHTRSVEPFLADLKRPD